MYGYGISWLGVQADLRVKGIPLVLFANSAQNHDSGDLDTAYSLGFMLGKADPGKFEFGILHQEIEKDALVGGLTDPDCAGGKTRGSGQQFRSEHGLV